MKEIWKILGVGNVILSSRSWHLGYSVMVWCRWYLLSKLVKPDRISLLASRWSELPSYVTHVLSSLTWGCHCGNSEMPYALLTSSSIPSNVPQSWVLETRSRAISPPKYLFPILCYSRACGVSKDLGQDTLQGSEWSQVEGLTGGHLYFPEVKSQKFYHDPDKQQACIPKAQWRKNKELVLRCQDRWGQGVQRVQLSTHPA